MDNIQPPINPEIPQPIPLVNNLAPNQRKAKLLWIVLGICGILALCVFLNWSVFYSPGLSTSNSIIKQPTRRIPNAPNSVIKQPTERASAIDIHTQNQKLANEAASLSLSESKAIGYSGKKILEDNKDLGCSIASPTTFGRSAVVNCEYRHSEYFEGSGDPQADVKAVYAVISHAGWTKWVAASGSRYESYLKDKSYIAAFPVSLENPNSKVAFPDHTLHINVINENNASFDKYYEDRSYGSLVINNPKPDYYLYGYYITYRYLMKAL